MLVNTRRIRLSAGMLDAGIALLSTLIACVGATALLSVFSAELTKSPNLIAATGVPEGNAVYAATVIY